MGMCGQCRPDQTAHEIAELLGTVEYNGFLRKTLVRLMFLLARLYCSHLSRESLFPAITLIHSYKSVLIRQTLKIMAGQC